MPRPMHFEIPADDPSRAMAFYEEVFQWSFQKWDGPQDYWLVTTGADPEPGINGGLAQRNPAMPQAVNTIGVQALDETLREVEKQGGRILMPRMAIPGVGWLAYCQDTEGNAFGLMQADPKAA